MLRRTYLAKKRRQEIEELEVQRREAAVQFLQANWGITDKAIVEGNARVWKHHRPTIERLESMGLLKLHPEKGYGTGCWCSGILTPLGKAMLTVIGSAQEKDLW